MPPALQILLPVHNEAASVERTVREIYDEVSKHVPVELIICEDGSTDRTAERLRCVQQDVPMRLLTELGRKGYAQAVIGGMRRMDAPYLLCMDGDGQCDPKDFPKFWTLRDHYDVIVGRRLRRADSVLRRTLSWGFYGMYQWRFRVPVHDPSCPFVLAHQRVIRALVPELGTMEQGFWWEFTARASRHGFSIGEVPVHHRARAAGQTRVYQPANLPRIGYRHVRALFQINHHARGRC